MKKKITKKLALSKETLRNLEAADLKNVAGGFTHSCRLTCECVSVIAQCAPTRCGDTCSC